MKKRIAIHTPFNPFHALNGAHIRARKVIDLVAASDIETHVVYTPLDGMGSNPAALADKAKGAGFKLYLISTKRAFKHLSGLSTETDIYPDDALEKISQTIASIAPNACLVNYIFLSKTLTLCAPSVDKYIDTHDKLSRASVFEDAGLEASFFCCTETHEAELCKRADCIIAITEKEREYFVRIAPQKKVITLGHSPSFAVTNKYIRSSGANRDAVKQLGILASGHVFNSNSINSLLRTFFPSPGVQLNIAGGVCDNVERDLLANKRIVLHGRVESAASFLRDQDLLLAPVDYGTGLKIKTAESILSAIPTIGTSVAFDGINVLSDKGIFRDSASLGSWLTHQNSEELGHYIKQIENLTLSRAVDYISHHRINESRFISFLASGIQSTCSDARFVNIGNEVKKITHVINITAASPESDLYVAQHLAIKSIVKAKDLANSISKNLEIKLVAKIIPDELEAVLRYIDLSGFKVETDIYTSHDISDPGNPKTRCLPILSSLLSPGKMDCVASNSFYIYTNSDICLKECFYMSVASIIKSDGNDALVINRRTVDKEGCIRDLSLDIANYSIGKTHPGFDCFAVREDTFSRFVLGNTIIGVHLIGRVLLWNIIRFCRKPVIYYDQTLTYHYGDDNSSKNEANHWYTLHNCSAAVAVLSKLGDTMEHKIAKNNLSPNILKITYKPDIYIESIAKPKIVLHGMFRVGSSYVYQKIRQSLGNRGICFYEPFHERLLSYHKESHPPNTEDSSMHPRLSDSSSLFDSYDRLIENKVSSEAVPFYSKDMSYYDMTGTIEEINHKKLIYISNLYEFAKNQDVQSILQPNRTWLLSEKQLKYIFDAEETTVNHFYIYRSPYDQFMSMLTHAKKTGSPGFFRSLLIILYHASCRQVNMLDSSVSLLVDKMKSTIGEQEARQDLVKDTAHALLVPLNVETALDIYIETLKLHLARFPFHMCTTIDINKVSSSLSYRRSIEYVLMRDYIYLDLDDCSIPTYPRGSSEWDAFCRKGGKRLDEEICQRLADSPLAVRPESNGMNTNVSNDWALVQNVSAESLTIQIARGTRLLLIPGSKRTVHKSSLKSLPNGVRIV